MWYKSLLVQMIYAASVAADDTQKIGIPNIMTCSSSPKHALYLYIYVAYGNFGTDDRSVETEYTFWLQCKGIWIHMHYYLHGNSGLNVRHSTLLYIYQTIIQSKPY